jgi:hypothetical protein
MFCHRLKNLFRQAFATGGEIKPVSLAIRDDGLTGINLAYVGMTAGNFND